MRIFYIFLLAALSFPACADQAPTITLQTHELAGPTVKLRFQGLPGTAFCALYATLDSQIEGRFGARVGQQDDRQTCLVTDHAGVAHDKIRVRGTGLLVVNILTEGSPTEVAVIPLDTQAE